VRLPEGVRVVTLMSQCFSGSFAHVLDGTEAEPDGSYCGYFASTARRPAHGCYPENRGRFNVGYSFRFIEAMRSTPLLPEAHARVLITDQTPDVPNRTSDYYLERLLERAAAEQGNSTDEFIDGLLEETWRNAGAARPEVELLEEVSQAFGSLNARSLQEIQREKGQLKSIEQQLSVYGRRWRLALTDLKRANLERFSLQNPEWASRVSPEAIESLGAEEREKLLREFLDALLAFSQADLSMWIRLETMRAWATPVNEARYRMEVRRATLSRLRSLLVRIAGRAYLETLATPDERSAFDRLDVCERLGLAEPEAPMASRLIEPTPFPDLEEDKQLAHAAAPGWIGIAYHRPKSGAGYGPGAVIVDRVHAGAPADRAGIRVADVILGPPDAHFTWANEIREWTMLSPVRERRDLELLRRGRPLTVGIRPDPFPLRLPQ
jgi:hypothetical protein